MRRRLVPVEIGAPLTLGDDIEGNLDSVFELGQRLIEIECLRIETAWHLDDGLPFEASLLRPPRLESREAPTAFSSSVSV